jgi:hypothetical protein
MIKDFEQQDFAASSNFSKSCATPKHGQKADVEDATIKRKLTERRSFEPRTAH